MKQPTAEKNGSISIWGGKGGKREKITKNCITKSSHPHFRHLQISKTEINVVIVFLAKIRRVCSSVLCKVEEVRIRNYNLEQWRAKIPLAHVSAHTLTRTGAHTTGVLFFCCHKCHTARSQTLLWWRKSTFIHPKNDTSVEEKQHIVFNKTTCHFQQNNVSFSIKQRIVFRKTSRRDYDAIDPFRFKANYFHGSPSV